MGNGASKKRHGVLFISHDNKVEYWRDYWTVSDVTGHAGVTGQYLANEIISDKSK